MHTEDFDRILFALYEAGIITDEQRRLASNAYYEQRSQIEAEAEERAKRLGFDRDRDTPFESFMSKVMMRPVSPLGIPLMFIVLIAWLVIAWLVF